MTIPKRFSEVLEENTPSFRMPKIVSSLGPIRFKTGGLAPGIIVEALVNDERVAHLVATKEANGNYIIDDVHVEPEYRNNGVATALLRTAHETVPMIPYALTDDQIYRSEAGRRLAIKELRIHTAGPLAAIPEIAAVAGEAAGVGEAAAGAGEAAAGASEAASSMPKIKVPSFSGHSTQNNNQDSDDDDDGGQGTTASTTWAIHQATTDPASIPTAILETAKDKAEAVGATADAAGNNSTFTMPKYMPATVGGVNQDVIKSSRKIYSNENEQEILSRLDKLVDLIKNLGCKCGAGCTLGQGCTKDWAPTDESPSEKIQDHDEWAEQTNHGEFDMPGPKKPLPPTTWQ